MVKFKVREKQSLKEELLNRTFNARINACDSHILQMAFVKSP